MGKITQGYQSLVEYTVDGKLAKRFVKPINIGTYSDGYIPEGIPVSELEDSQVRLSPDDRAFHAELYGHAFMRQYFPVSEILDTDETSTTIVYEPFEPNIRLDDLVRKVIEKGQGKGYDLTQDPYGRILIEANKSLGASLRKLHEDTYDASKHKVKGTMDFRDGNVLVKEPKSLNGEKYNVIDFTSFGEIDVYFALTVLPLTEMITASALYEQERKLDSEFKPEHLDLIAPALQAFVEGYIGESVPTWLTHEQIEKYDTVTSGLDLTLFSIVTNQMPNAGIQKPGILMKKFYEAMESKSVYL